MGNHHSHETKSGGDQSGSGTSTPRGSQRGAGSRSGSGGDLQGLAESKEKAPLSMVPVEKLGKRSFMWLYSAPWDSLPTALIGVLVAFVHHSHQADDYQPAQSTCMRVLYRLSVPCMFAWVMCGYWMKGVTHPLLVTLYATIDRPIFATFTAVAMYGFFNKIDSIWWKVLSWRIWPVLGRMSLSVYLIHWLFSLTLLALRYNVNNAGFFDIGGHWLSTTFLTYLAAVPLHLLIELPVMKFLQCLTA